LRDLENRARIIENTVLKKVSSLGLHIDRLKPIPIPIPADVREFSLLPHVGDLEGSNTFLFVLTNASKLDTEFYTEIKRELLERSIQSIIFFILRRVVMRCHKPTILEGLTVGKAKKQQSMLVYCLRVKENDLLGGV
jgi:hypothetical protein